MNEQLISVGIFLLFVGMILIILGSFTGTKNKEGTTSAKVAVGGFIGLIPFGFFNDREMIVPFLIIFALSLLAFIFLRKYF